MFVLYCYVKIAGLNELLKSHVSAAVDEEIFDGTDTSLILL